MKQVKHTTFLAMLCLLLPLFAFAQPPTEAQRMQKYWNYRHRLQKYFNIYDIRRGGGNPAEYLSHYQGCTHGGVFVADSGASLSFGENSVLNQDN